MADTAKALHFPLPLASTAFTMFTAASNAGYGKEDDSAVIKILPASICRRKGGNLMLLGVIADDLPADRYRQFSGASNRADGLQLERRAVRRKRRSARRRRSSA